MASLLALVPGLASGAETTIVDANFDTGDNGFSYADDTFRDTSASVFADGFRDDSNGLTGGGLEVSLGGLDGTDVFGMSGGWRQGFSLAQDAAVRVELDYNLTQAADYEWDEFSQVLAAVDGMLIGRDGQDHIDEVIGDGNGGSARTTGWQHATLELGTLAAGEHEIVLGGYNNKKTYWNESTLVSIDNVRIVATTVDDGGSTDGGSSDGGSVPSTEFTVELLPRPSGFVTVPFDLNEGGEAVGYYNDNSLAYRAVYWRADGTAVDLASAGTWSQAHGISDTGQISGYYGETLQTSGPVVWDGGRMSSLKLPRGYSGGVAEDVSGSGLAVGHANDGSDNRIMMWQGTRPIAPSGDHRGGINEVLETDAAVGSVMIDGWSRAAHWAPDGTMTILAGADGQPSSSAVGISPDGRIVGFGLDATGSNRVLVWGSEDATPMILDRFEDKAGVARDINSFGWVVGADIIDRYNGTGRALLWDETGVPLDLNERIVDSGWTLQEAVAVNDSGQILGSGTCTCGSTGRVAFVLTPVP